MPVGTMPEIFKEAVEAFILLVIRDYIKKHKTMMVNITQLNLLQAQIAVPIEDYLIGLRNAINNIGLELMKLRKIRKSLN